eukprot:CAMPEP_0170175332 /NCGR_PEP_ID=MMETSP0040_2-20121228/8421_1 /TAXON_ID=641309 /ORGANISM="Lotharella oceanica, Strain CCMP622" /LENGTH=138 /DNA_ID=CAMNT_0010417277 /DNA_START=1505 /DNA_END=1922 /DNA_ORIENTATION=+
MYGIGSDNADLLSLLFLRETPFVQDLHLLDDRALATLPRPEQQDAYRPLLAIIVVFQLVTHPRILLQVEPVHVGAAQRTHAHAASAAAAAAAAAAASWSCSAVASGQDPEKLTPALRCPRAGRKAPAAVRDLEWNGAR